MVLRILVIVVALAAVGCTSPGVGGFGPPWSFLDPASAAATQGGQVVIRTLGLEGAQITGVEWSVRETGGGSVAGSYSGFYLGTYTAPQAAGTFHVDATISISGALAEHHTATITVN